MIWTRRTRCCAESRRLLIDKSMSRWTEDNCGATDFLAMGNEWGLGMKYYQ